MQQSAVGHNHPPCLEMTFNRAATNPGHYQRRAKSLVPFFTVNTDIMFLITPLV